MKTLYTLKQKTLQESLQRFQIQKSIIKHNRNKLYLIYVYRADILMNFYKIFNMRTLHLNRKKMSRCIDSSV